MVRDVKKKIKSIGKKAKRKHSNSYGLFLRELGSRSIKH